MGKQRSRHSRTEGKGRAALTRRQQKRAVQRVRGISVDSTTAAENLVHSPATETAPAAPSLPSDQDPRTRNVVTAENPDPTESAAIESQPSRPRRARTRRAAVSASSITDKAAAAVKEKAAESEQALSPSASFVRKHPTLAVMAAISSRTAPGASEPSAAPSSPAETAAQTATEGVSVTPPEPADSDVIVTGQSPVVDSPDASLVLPSREDAFRQETPHIRPRMPHTRPIPAIRLPLREASAGGDGSLVAAQAVRRLRLSTLPEVDLHEVVAGVYAACTAGTAFIGAALLINGSHAAAWPFSFAAIGGIGGLGGYGLLQRGAREAAGEVLVAAQLLALGWAFLLLGPQMGLLLLTPALLVLALRLSGPRAATCEAIAALVLFTLATILTQTGIYVPAIQPVGAGVVVLNVCCAVAGITLAYLTFFAMYDAEQVARATARSRTYDAHLLRERYSALRDGIQRDAEAIQTTLGNALRGSDQADLILDGPLSSSADLVRDIADRLATLQRDREERVRLEGALHTAIQAVERSWLGLPWSWPEPSGTALDDLLALLRAPRPARDASTSNWLDEQPTLVPLPTLYSPTSQPPRSPISGAGWSSRPRHRAATASAREARPVLRGPSIPEWSEWDTWPNWRDADEW